MKRKTYRLGNCGISAEKTSNMPWRAVMALGLLLRHPGICLLFSWPLTIYNKLSRH